jgi:phenylacetate-coenzyme A ligase PaaK-like adenylate-forming protein
LIRYELADRVDFIEDPCPCGSMYTRLSGVRGRLDDVFVYQDGTRVHPIVFRSVLGRDTHVVEYQVRQTARGASIMLRGDAGMNERDIVSSIEHGLRRVGLRDPKVEVTIAHAIPRQATGKLRRFVPMVGEH